MLNIDDYKEVITYPKNELQRLGTDELLLLLAELIDDDDISEVVSKYVDDYYADWKHIYNTITKLQKTVSEYNNIDKMLVTSLQTPCMQIINTEEQLQRVTGLSHEALWDNGFNLDDWDFAIVSNKKLTNNNARWLLRRMESYCCGYECTKYEDKYYYLIYHA